MSKKSEKAMVRAVAARDRAEAKSKAADRKAAQLAEKVRQTEADAKAHGVDLNNLPTKAQRVAAEQAAAAEDAREQAEADLRRPTAVRMAEVVQANRPQFGHSVINPGPVRSADRIAHTLLADGLLGRQADPSRDTLPVERFLRSTAEVLAQTQPGRRPVGQSRVVVPQQQRTRSMVRQWGAAPGQLNGVKVVD